MDWSVYGTLIAGALAMTGAAAFVAVRGLQAWRDFKRFRRQVIGGLDDLATAAERTAEAAERAADSTELATTLARLRVTLARFNVLRSALDEATESVRPFTVFYPRK